MNFPKENNPFCLDGFLNPNSFHSNLFPFSNEAKYPCLSNILYLSTPKCPICLSFIEKPCIPDCCSHKFCFSCLKKWKNFKSNCPYCRQKFKKILFIK